MWGLPYGGCHEQEPYRGYHVEAPYEECHVGKYQWGCHVKCGMWGVAMWGLPPGGLNGWHMGPPAGTCYVGLSHVHRRCAPTLQATNLVSESCM